MRTDAGDKICADSFEDFAPGDDEWIYLLFLCFVCLFDVRIGIRPQILPCFLPTDFLDLIRLPCGTRLVALDFMVRDDDSVSRRRVSWFEMHNVSNVNRSDMQEYRLSRAHNPDLAIEFLQTLTTQILLQSQGQYPLVQLVKRPLLLPVIPSGNSHHNRNRHAHRNTLNPINLGLPGRGLVNP